MGLIWKVQEAMTVGDQDTPEITVLNISQSLKCKTNVSAKRNIFKKKKKNFQLPACDMNEGFGSLSIEWLAPLYTQKPMSVVVELTDKQIPDDSGVKLLVLKG